MAEAQRYIVHGALHHNGQHYPHGSEIILDDTQTIAELRYAGAIKFPAEVIPPQAIEAERVALAEVNASLQEKLALLERELAAAKAGQDNQPPAAIDEDTVSKAKAAAVSGFAGTNTKK